MKIFDTHIALVLVSAALFIGLARESREGLQGNTVSTNVHDGSIRRVVSLSPSITRQMADLGAQDLLVGVTTYHPPLEKEVEVVSTVVQPNLERIYALRPQAVFFSGDDVIALQGERLRVLGLPVIIFEKNFGFDDICRNYIRLAALLGREAKGHARVKYYREELLRQRRAPGVRCAFFVSHNPLVAAGGSSFIDAVIRDSGGVNVFGGVDIPYPIVSLETLAAREPEVIISMMPGAVEFFSSILKDMPACPALESGRVFSVKDDHIPYYTPRDYLESVRLISMLLDGEHSR
ncbi:MAG: hypothetical protein CVV27_22055 [Candidatus Melainabacteria bacterium HGW-Melainabacteria-1]|nr:MAG: hypothetical protein CVV27_22055 [Candidatus Melainabacteria bacterium HGW-Melainabacteria-1]